MKKLFTILACSIVMLQCQKSEIPKVDERDKFIGTYTGTLNLRSNDGSINDNLFETWNITKYEKDLKISRVVANGSFEMFATASAEKLSVSKNTATGDGYSFSLGSGQCALSNSILNVDLAFVFTTDGVSTPGSFVGNLIKK